MKVIKNEEQFTCMYELKTVMCVYISDTKFRHEYTRHRIKIKLTQQNN